MIEKIIFDYLQQNIETTVVMELPESFEAPLVVVEKTGSSLSDHVYKAVIAVQSYGETLYESAQLNELVKETMLDIISLDKISKIEINSDYNYTDTASKRYRYQAVFNVTYLK